MLSPSLRKLAFLVLLMLVAAGALLAVAFHYSFSSDDVAIQVILSNWLQGFHDHTWTGPDNFLIKIPIYYLGELILPHTRLGLFLMVLVLCLGNLLLFWYAVNYFVKKYAPAGAVTSQVALIWMAALSVPFIIMLLVINTRNLEIGLSFAGLVLAAKYLNNEVKFSGFKGRMLVGLALLTVGFFIYSDVYFLYVLMAPLLLALIIALIFRFEPRRFKLLCFLLASAVLYKIWAAVFAKLGFRIVELKPAFVTLDGLNHNFQLFLEGFLNMFNANFFGRQPASLGAITAMLNIGIVLWIFLYLWRMRNNIDLQAHFWRYFFALQILVTGGVFILSNYAVDIVYTRYLVMIPFDVVILLGFLAASLPLKARRYLLILIVVAALSNAASLCHYAHSAPRAGNDINYDIVKKTASLGLTKGYAPYWNASINTYLSGNKISYIPMICGNGHFALRGWLMEDGVAKKPSQRTFLLFDPDTLPVGGCSLDSAKNQFGDPYQSIKLTSSITLLVYDYDISEKIRY